MRPEYYQSHKTKAQQSFAPLAMQLKSTKWAEASMMEQIFIEEIYINTAELNCYKERFIEQNVSQKFFVERQSFCQKQD